MWKSRLSIKDISQGSEGVLLTIGTAHFLVEKARGPDNLSRQEIFGFTCKYVTLICMPENPTLHEASFSVQLARPKHWKHVQSWIILGDEVRAFSHSSLRSSVRFHLNLSRLFNAQLIFQTSVCKGELIKSVSFSLKMSTAWDASP